MTFQHFLNSIVNDIKRIFGLDEDWYIPIKDTNFRPTECPRCDKATYFIPGEFSIYCKHCRIVMTVKQGRRVLGIGETKWYR